MLFYLPLEPYKERYTCLLSAKDGWIEDRFKRAKVKFTRVEGQSLSDHGVITHGQVLDSHNRSYWSLTQNAAFIKLMREGKVKDGDILYYDDFWTPGMEAIFYTADQLGINLKIYAMLHAQSVDKHDFTYKMRRWMRDYEKGQSKYMAGVFVTCEYLQDLCEEAGIQNTFLTGLPYNMNWIERNFPVNLKKKNKIVYTSRFDSEKNPTVFLKMAKVLHKQYECVMTTSSSEIKSNDKEILMKMRDAERKGWIKIKTGLSKHQYYQELASAKYQVNTALQDWVSWTVIEATHHGCIPIYPQYRSFPEVLPAKFLYNPGDADSLVAAIRRNQEFDPVLKSIPLRFDKAFDKCLRIMSPKK